MKLESSKKADELHRKNCSEIRRLIEEYNNPDTPKERKSIIKGKFKEILEHAEKIQQHNSLFTKMTNIKNQNGKR